MLDVSPRHLEQRGGSSGLCQGLLPRVEGPSGRADSEWEVGKETEEEFQVRRLAQVCV